MLNFSSSRSYASCSLRRDSRHLRSGTQQCALPLPKESPMEDSGGFFRLLGNGKEPLQCLALAPHRYGHLHLSLADRQGCGVNNAAPTCDYLRRATISLHYALPNTL